MRKRPVKLNRMLKAVIFDFNGVIADDESIHFELFSRVLSEERIRMTRREYNRSYLHLNDRDAFSLAYDRQGKPLSRDYLAGLIRRKSEYYRELLRDRDLLFPDAAQFIRATAARFPIAIASGALNAEIETILKRAGLLELFPVIIGAEKAVLGKPEPECYLTALEELNLHYGIKPKIKNSEVLVIEDSVGGIDGAHRAGMLCLAVANSYPPNELRSADFVVETLSQIDFKVIQSQLEK